MLLKKLILQLMVALCSLILLPPIIYIFSLFSDGVGYYKVMLHSVCIFWMFPIILLDWHKDLDRTCSWDTPPNGRFWPPCCRSPM